MQGLCFGILIMYCPPPEPVKVVSEYCQVAQILKVSKKDTAKTIRQVRAHNTKYQKRCKK